ncbi:hypothetical protein LPN04_29475 [Rugamonas sp. A1-17]|nr:hypothetical protein [Rugamonas sp. A1-17]
MTTSITTAVPSNLDLRKINFQTISELRRRGHSEAAIAAMTPETAYSEFCKFRGISNPEQGPAKVLANLLQAASSTVQHNAA